MGLEGIGVKELLLILVIVALVFGTSRLKNMGGDLGSALKSFRNAMRDHDDHAQQEDKETGSKDTLGGQEGGSADAQFTASGDDKASEKTR